MKKYFLFLIFLTTSCISYANFNSSVFVGMQNQKYLFAGVDFKSNGFVLTQSLFNQDPDQQYGRLAVFANYKLSFCSELQFLLYSGTQYKHDYYDFGSRFTLLIQPFPNILQVTGIYQPFYDSELKGEHGYQFQITAIPLEEVQLFLGLKNIPDYRDVEQRYLAGATFKVRNLRVSPEISTPIKGSFEWTRINVNFVYIFI